MEGSIEEQLIHAVKKRSVLYDTSNLKYKNNGYRKKLWSDISKELGIRALDCQTKWKRLRERYSCFQKRVNSESTSIEINKATPFILKKMDFLKPYVYKNSKNGITITSSAEADVDPPPNQLCDTDGSYSLTSFFSECKPEINVVCTMLADEQPEMCSTLQSEYSPPQSESSPQRSECSPPRSECSPLRKLRRLLPKPATPHRTPSPRNQDTDIQNILDAINAQSEDLDAIDYFCLSLTKELKDMDPTEQRRVKLEFLKILANATYIS